MPSVLKAAAIFLLCLAVGSCTRAGETGLNPGDLAPDFALPTVDGKLFRLSEQRGKVVVLNFWATWCAPCEAEMPALGRLYDALAAKGLVVAAVAVQEPDAELAEFQQKYGIAFPVPIDAEGKTRDLYKVKGFPETIVIDSNGKIVLFNDPEDDSLRVRIVGPREWDGPAARRRIEELLPPGKR